MQHASINIAAEVTLTAARKGCCSLLRSRAVMLGTELQLWLPQRLRQTKLAVVRHQQLPPCPAA